MKDFFDLDFLARSFEFDGSILTHAIEATFKRRDTEIPQGDPVAFTNVFTDDRQKIAQWNGFLKRSGVSDVSLTLSAVVASIRMFAGPPIAAARVRAPFLKLWSCGKWK